MERELTYQEVAALKGVSVATVRRWVADGELAVRRYGYRTVRVPLGALRRLEQRKTERAHYGPAH